MRRPVALLVRPVVEILRAALWMLVIEVALRTSPLPATCRRLHVRLDLGRSQPATARAVLPGWASTPIRAAVVVSRRWPAGDTCLRRCLVIGHRLRRLQPVLRIGVRRDESGTFRAHAWLEVDGHALDTDAALFTGLQVLP